MSSPSLSPEMISTLDSVAPAAPVVKACARSAPPVGALVVL